MCTWSACDPHGALTPDISLLKLCKGSNYPHKYPPLEVIGDDEKYEVEEILESCHQCRHVQYLIKWKGYSNCNN